MPDVKTIEDVISVAKEYLHEENIAFIRKAYAIAEKMHEGQFRKSGDAYVQHPLEVAYILAELHSGPSTIVAALVHDVLITFLFFLPGVFYGLKVGKFKSANDVVKGMGKQMGTMGSVLVLTFFSYNFLALLSKSGLGTYITYLGGNALKAINLSEYPILLIIGFIVITGLINLFVGGLTSKWMLLGPIFLPMLYQVNSNMTPEVVAAAYRVADS